MMYSNGDFSCVPTFTLTRVEPADVVTFMTQYQRHGFDPIPDRLDSVVLDLLQQARLIDALAHCECNGVRTPQGARITEAQHEEIEQRHTIARYHAKKDIEALFPRGTEIEFNRDPRGAPIKLTIPQADGTAPREFYIGVTYA